MPAMTIYAGMKVLSETPFQRYFGYSKPLIHRLFKRFLIPEETVEVRIPERFNRKYLLLKGSFLNDFNTLAEKNFQL